MVYLIVVCFIVVWYLVEINFSQFKTFKIEILKIKPKPQIDGFKIFKATVKVSTLWLTVGKASTALRNSFAQGSNRYW